MATYLWGLTHSSSVGADCCPLCAAVSRVTPSLGWEQMDVGGWVVLCGQDSRWETGFLRPSDPYVCSEVNFPALQPL